MLSAIIRTANRKQELQMLVEELTRARGSSIPSELAVRARRLTELGHSEFEMVCVLRAQQRGFHADRANATYCSRRLRLLPSHTWRCSCPQLETNLGAVPFMQASAVRKMNMASQVPPTPLPHSIAVSGSYCRPPALDGTRWYRTNEHEIVAAAGLRYCGSAFFALVIHGADKSKVGNDGGADQNGKQLAARPPQPALRLDGVGP